MSLYLLHIEPGYKHARHYSGFTVDQKVDRRVQEHLGGCRSKASPLVVAALDAGCTVTLARRWEGRQFDRHWERKIKNTRRLPDYCPICCRERRARRKAARNASDDQLELIALTQEAAQ